MKTAAIPELYEISPYAQFAIGFGTFGHADNQAAPHTPHARSASRFDRETSFQMRSESEDSDCISRSTTLKSANRSDVLLIWSGKRPSPSNQSQLWGSSDVARFSSWPPNSQCVVVESESVGFVSPKVGLRSIPSEGLRSILSEGLRSILSEGLRTILSEGLRSIMSEGLRSILTLDYVPHLVFKFDTATGHRLNLHEAGVSASTKMQDTLFDDSAAFYERMDFFRVGEWLCSIEQNADEIGDCEGLLRCNHRCCPTLDEKELPSKHAAIILLVVDLPLFTRRNCVYVVGGFCVHKYCGKTANYADDALVTSLALRVSVGGGDYPLSDVLAAHLSLD
ncbi:hypothetical protein EVAR_79532_1 [Eumeta japonica]|uniref:Uncharacterized protein n=1 Tax=Eumeta variegata TaxID=151549 RepID=A0A4C1Y6Z5_EUMVA|nr:hypothetical protein EVAR_79532_1 [Eumeta japonica]